MVSLIVSESRLTRYLRMRKLLIFSEEHTRFLWGQFRFT